MHAGFPMIDDLLAHSRVGALAGPPVPVDSAAVVAKAMAFSADERYPSALEMAEDLRRFVNRFAISAKRAGPMARTVRDAAVLLGVILTPVLGIGLLILPIGLIFLWAAIKIAVKGTFKLTLEAL